MMSPIGRLHSTMLITGSSHEPLAAWSLSFEKPNLPGRQSLQPRHFSSKIGVRKGRGITSFVQEEVIQP